MGILGLERGDSHLQLHIQGMLRITTSSTRALKTEIPIKNVSYEQKEEWRWMHVIYVEVADVDNILFGIDTPARYFEAPTAVKAKSDDSEPPLEPDDIQLPAEDKTAPIPVVNLESTEGSGADLDPVQEALLGAGFAVGRKTNKEMESNNLLPEYIRLWGCNYSCLSSKLSDATAMAKEQHSRPPPSEMTAYSHTENEQTADTRQCFERIEHI
ncbi:hypothetical protein R1sor_019165 [Riccia sorocarpa]|uniref:Uncharacterized protein n=1 Tax=Riccia sorocarpa TaxID=122646 RepID=A0ABD3IBT4_9MARC